MKWKINGLKDSSWLHLVVMIIMILALAFCAYSFIWWLITLLLGIPFAWNHAAVFYLICMACGGVNTKWEGV